MGLRGKALRGSAVLAGGEVLGYGASFVRNMILARVLAKADFGIAATLAMAISLLEFSARLGIARFVVRDKEGDQPEFLATAHMVQAAASVLSALLMAAAAWPLAVLFGLREHVTALLVLAVIPLLHGLVHLDVRRQERDLRFSPSMWTEAIPQVIITVLAWPVGVWFGDYRAVLALLILKAILTSVGSHRLAQKPYRWACHREFTTRMIRFGWPLIINGFLMFFMLRGDQFLVATFYSMGDLGAYAAAATLTTAPTLVFSRIFASVMLPVMARVQDDPAAFNRRYRLVIALIAAFTAAYAVSVILGAEWFMRLAFGSQYVGSGAILAWLTAGNALRNVRVATAIAALAKGDSVNEMVSTSAGAVSLLAAAALAVTGQPVWMVAGASVIGGIASSTVSFVRLSRRDGVPVMDSLKPMLLVGVATLGAGLILLLDLPPVHPVLWLTASVTLGTVVAAAIALLLPSSREEARRLWHRRASLPVPAALRPWKRANRPAPPHGVR